MTDQPTLDTLTAQVSHLTAEVTAFRNQPSLRHCLYPGCLREFDMAARMEGREPARPSWSGDGWKQIPRSPANGYVCPAHADRVDTLTAVAKGNKRHVQEMFLELQKVSAEVVQWRATFGADALPDALARLKRTEDERDEAQAALTAIRHLHKDSPMGPCPVCIDADAIAEGRDGADAVPLPDRPSRGSTGLRAHPARRPVRRRLRSQP